MTTPAPSAGPTIGGMSLAETLQPVADLVGTWRGPGAGRYPTIDDFEYTEELVFADVGKPFLTYVQRTWSPAGAPMHTESGFLRVPGPGAVEFVLAQPTGHSELAVGELGAGAGVVTLDLAADVVSSPSAKPVTATRRSYRLDRDVLVTDFAMAAVGLPMTHHLHSELRRVQF